MKTARAMRRRHGLVRVRANNNGQASPPGMSGVTAISAGETHSLALVG